MQLLLRLLDALCTFQARQACNIRRVIVGHLTVLYAFHSLELMTSTSFQCCSQVLHGRIPAKHPYSDAPVAVFQSLNDFVGSFRHALFDFILPVFNLMQLFRMYTPEFLLIEAAHQVDRPWHCQALPCLPLNLALFSIVTLTANDTFLMRSKLPVGS